MTASSAGVAIVGTGYVADLYLRSFRAHPEIALRGASRAQPDMKGPRP